MFVVVIETQPVYRDARLVGPFTSEQSARNWAHENFPDGVVYGIERMLDIYEAD